MKFVVFAPDKVHNSAGVMCLYLLHDYLKELGHEVRLYNYQDRKCDKVIHKDEVLIIPETLNIEVADSFKVARWCLNHPGKLGGDTQYKSNEIVFHYSPEIEESARAASHDKTTRLFTLGCIEVPSVSNERIFDAWYEGKGKSDGTHKDALIRITRHWPPTKDELYDVLSYTDKLYSYDDFTALNLEAHLMGCRVCVKKDGEWKNYVPPAHWQSLILNHENNLERVKQFVEQLA